MYDLEVDLSYGMHVVEVDPDGNIWFGMYGHPTDSLVRADTVWIYIWPQSSKS